MSGYKTAFKRAFPYTIPVLTGYLFIGIAFGVMYAEKGYSAWWAVLMSLLVYAGSGQYLAGNFFAGYFFPAGNIYDSDGEYTSCFLRTVSAGQVS